MRAITFRRLSFAANLSGLKAVAPDYYAETDTTASALVSSGVKAHKQPPAGLVKHLKEAETIVAAIRAARIKKFAPDRAARWEKRRDAVKRQRALAKAQSFANIEAESDAAQFSGEAQSQINAMAVTGATVGLMILVGDGLTDDEESILGTNPNSVDSEDDGLVDGGDGQVLLSAYPTGIDSEGNGFVDGEADYGTDPNTSNIGDLAPRGNPDNAITTGDLLVLTRFVIGMSDPNAVEAVLGDIDGDGDLDIGDLILMQHTLMNGSPP